MAEKTQEIKDNLRPFLKHANIIATNQGPFAFAPYPGEQKGMKWKEYARFSSANIRVANETCYPDSSIDGGKCIDGSNPLDKIKQTEAFWNNLEIYPVTDVEDSRWASAVSHRTKKPTYKNAIMTQTDEGFNIKPRNVSVLVLHYYFKPDYVKFNYTTSPPNIQTGAGDQIIYNAKQPGEFLWPETMINEFLTRLRDAYFNFTRDQIGNAIDNSQKRQ